MSASITSASLRAPRDAPPPGDEAPPAVVLRMPGMQRTHWRHPTLLDAPIGCIEVASICRAIRMQRRSIQWVQPMRRMHPITRLWMHPDASKPLNTYLLPIPHLPPNPSKLTIVPQLFDWD